MPPRIHCIRGLKSSSSSSSSTVRHFSSTIPKNRAFPSASPSASKTPSKYQLLRAKQPTHSNRSSPFLWGSKSQLPISRKAFEINPEQNAINEIRPNPTMIDTKADVDEAALKQEEAMNTPFRRHGRVSDQRTMLLESKYSFPLKEGQLYTDKDLSFRAWENREKVHRAVSEITVDPFKKLNIDPFWEFKNYALLSNFVTSMGRILPASKTGCSAKNQRKLGRAIRRARALGFMPIWSRHPALQQGTMRLPHYMQNYMSPSHSQWERQSTQTRDSDNFLRQVMANSGI